MKNRSIERCTDQLRVKTRGIRSPRVSLKNSNSFPQARDDGNVPEADLSPGKERFPRARPTMLRIQQRAKPTLNDM